MEKIKEEIIRMVQEINNMYVLKTIKEILEELKD
nr:MAG TPA: hypothetical protein [Bacteriophage sp.]